MTDADVFRAEFPRYLDGDGPVLELGIGDGSTPLLAEIAADRLVVSVDDDPAWLARFEDLASSSRVFVLARGEDVLRVIRSRRWSLALVDHAPGSARAAAVAALADFADVIVVHDTEESAEPVYPGLRTALAAFPFRRDVADSLPRLTVVSSVRPV